MKTRQEKIEWYTFCYWVYGACSFLALLGVLTLGIFFYFTKFQEVVTVSQLFLLLLIMLLAIYLRINALHYHQAVLDLKRNPTQLSRLRSEGRPMQGHPRTNGGRGYEHPS